MAKLHKVRVSASHNGIGSVEIDGVKIENAVRSISLKVRAGEMPVVTVEFIGDVEIDAETKSLFEKAPE